MDWNQIGAQWDQLKGEIKQEWAALTDDDLEYIAGMRDRLVGRLREKYGMPNEEAERLADQWVASGKDPAA
jgi:uncharacterized protein YjbJ (UPF0337 family)